ncbi:Unknown protein [Striga hermonthica]|uniref:Uncharacterized protein n=1 Tax=Striga hermonthica TaxID=68872 RepID=A0A9N7R2Y0_STRHE|nr:Unknown protein [Striga hermonthica]
MSSLLNLVRDLTRQARACHSPGDNNAFLRQDRAHFRARFWPNLVYDQNRGSIPYPTSLPLDRTGQGESSLFTVGMDALPTSSPETKPLTERAKLGIYASQVDDWLAPDRGIREENGRERSEYTREDVGPSSVGPPERTPVDQHTLESVKQLLADHAYIADRIQDLCRALRTNVPGGFQAERLTEILEERHGGETMSLIRQSLETQALYTFFREVQTDFDDFLLLRLERHGMKPNPRRH